VKGRSDFDEIRLSHRVVSRFAVKRMSSELEQILDRLNTRLLLHPKDHHTRFNQARTLQKLARFGEAVESYRRAVKIKPDLSEAFFGLGECELALENLEGAAEAFGAAAAAKPDYFEALVAQADALMHLERAADAAEPLRRAVKLNPNDANCLLKLGRSHAAGGRFTEAIEPLERAYGMMPNDSALGLDLGRVHAKAQSFERAKAVLAPLATGLRRRDAWCLLAEALVALGEGAPALDAYQSALELEPEHLPTLLAAAELAARLGHVDEAALLYGRTRALSPGVPGLALIHAELLLGLSRVDEAAAAFRNALAETEASAPAHAGLGACLAARNEYIDALAELSARAISTRTSPERTFTWRTPTNA
jgi:tetratricopeptide (TPR) repeat protein